MIVRTTLACTTSLALLALPTAHADPMDQAQPFVRLSASRPAAVELSVTALGLPNGDRTALLGLNYLMAVNEEWGFGPAIYGAAQGNYGGLFTAGFSAQRRWRVGGSTHLAVGLYAGGGGGLSSDQLRFGGGLMLRPEISLRTEMGDWYAGVSLVHTRFPSGNVSDTSFGLVLGRATDFASFSPADAGKPGRANARTGLGFDEISLFGGHYQPSSSTRNRAGQPSTARMGKAGVDLRRYIAEGSWWGFEAAGAAQGGSDGYRELLLNAGQDWALGTPALRGGAQLSVGLGGGGNVDTGSGWLLRAGPSLRWRTPWGLSLRLDGGWTYAPSGHFSGSYVQLGLGLPLDQAPDHSFIGDTGIVRRQQWFVTAQQLSSVGFKDGSHGDVGQVGVLITREFNDTLYGAAHAGSAAWGSAGGFSYGMFGLGLQSPDLPGRTRLGVELLGGAAGGGGVDVGGGAVMQANAWAQWQGSGDWERLVLRAGLGQWRTIRGSTQSASAFNLSVGYAFGTLGR